MKDKNLKASGKELNLLEHAPASFTLTPAAAASNVCEVTIQAVDANGNAIKRPFMLDVWLSDAATGAGLTGTTASGTVQAKSAKGTDVATLVSKKALKVQTLVDGSYILEITASAKTAFYVCVQNPVNGQVFAKKLATADYGA